MVERFVCHRHCSFSLIFCFGHFQRMAEMTILGPDDSFESSPLPISSSRDYYAIIISASPQIQQHRIAILRASAAPRPLISLRVFISLFYAMICSCGFVLQLLVLQLVSPSSYYCYAASSDETTKPTTTTTSSTVNDKAATNDFGIFEWIQREEGGYVNPSQEYRLLLMLDNNEKNDGDRNRGDSSSATYGMVATQPIAKGETLLRVPWSLIITASNSDSSTSSGAPNNPNGPMPCAMVQALAHELELGAEASSYAPFVQYLQDAIERPPMNHLPSAWSPQGQHLLQQIVGIASPGPPKKNRNKKRRRFDHNAMIPPIEPTEWIALDWLEICQGDPKDSMAALLVVQWAEDGILVPVVSGMYAHRNGALRWTNADVTTEEHSRQVTVKATRDIAVGETIYISQNLCAECESRAQAYGTAEMLRDYGFIEPYPQRWHYRELEIQFEVDRNETTGRFGLTWEIEWTPDKPEEHGDMIVWLKRQIRRLRKLRNIEYRKGNPPGKSAIPPAEWETAWEFQQANVRAMTMAIKALEASAPGVATSLSAASNHSLLEWEASELLVDAPHYHPLEWEYDDLDYRDETCDNDEAMDFPHHREVEFVPTPYQQMQFTIEPKSKDVVLELDHIVQIASIYRPQYHEYSVHAAARYLDSVKRVIFIGGGDSMLLHEVLKYPELELVVGLELDQLVTRKSFKYFHTQPHFDDPRVEWWFGDATKSLLLLSKDYWQSFDLVLVDLSETVMSLSVTAELDVFDALALLLKPEGVLVKNEQYLEPVSQVFDHSMHIVYECPIICDQVLTMGSNKVDFLHSPVKDHGIPTLLYEPLVSPDNRLNFLHDYRTNDARAQGKCDAPPECAIPAEEQSKSAGIMEIVDVEQIPIPLDETLVQVLEDTIAKQGFELATSPVLVSDSMILLVMKEGYIMARLWPSKKYCSMEIKLWGRFGKLHSLRTSLTEAMQSPLVSNFRVVVGGMFGSSTWNEDRNLIGPQIVQARDCEEKSFSDDPPSGVALPSANELIVAAVEESLVHVVKTKDNVAVALCGTEAETCLAADLLEKSETVSNVIRLFTCSDLDVDDSSTMYECEIAVASKWKKAQLGKKGKTQLLLVDQTATMPLLQIVDSILSQTRYRTSLVAPTNVFLAWSSVPKEESWRKYFLENYRRHYLNDPISRGEIRIQSGTQLVEFGVVSCADDKAPYAFQKVESSLRKRFPPREKLIDISLQTIRGGKYPWLEPWEPKKFLQSDYDNQPGLDQYFKQQPLAHHVVFQLEPREGKPLFKFSVDGLASALENALKQVQFDCPHQSIYQGLGDGCLVACLNPSLGSVLLAWDGRTHVDVSYYRIGTDTDSLTTEFSRSFLMQARAKLQVTLQDAMPRGTGRTINPASDLRTPAELEDFFRRLSESPSKAQLLAQHHGDEDEDDYDE